jgi:hypothetical protein
MQFLFLLHFQLQAGRCDSKVENLKLQPITTRMDILLEHG